MATKTKNTRGTKGRKRPTKTSPREVLLSKRSGKTIGEILAERGVNVPKAEKPLPAGLVEKAAERAGITSPEVVAGLREVADQIDPRIPPPLDPAIDAAEEAERGRVVAAIGPSLVLACDQLSEEIAAIADSAGGAGRGGNDHNVVDALMNLWRIRWVLGLTPKSMVKDEGEEQTDGAA